MIHGLGIEIKVRLHHRGTEGLSYSVFREILDSLNRSAYESEKRELHAIQREFPHLPDVAFDDANHRLKEYRYSAIIIKDIRPGSLIVVGCVAGAAIWVLQQTLGETLKEAWLDSESHQKLKEVLLKRRGDKGRSLAADAKERIIHAVPSKVGYCLTCSMPGKKTWKEEPYDIEIDVWININPKDYPPDRKDLF